MLDNPLGHDTTYRYISQLHFRTPNFNQIIRSYKYKEEETFLTEILLNCLISDHKERCRTLNIPAAKKPTKKELVRRMIMAKDYIFSNYSDPNLSVSNLSELVSMSHFHFLRTFKNVYGISPYQYIKSIRIEKAKYLISETDLPISEIACAVGFQESTALYPILKKELSQTPLTYRKIILHLG